MESATAHPVSASPTPPSTAPARAIAGLLVNLIVLPGLGTLISGDRAYRKIGWLQLALGALLVPSIALLTNTGWSPAGMSSGAVREVLGQFMIALAVWSGLTSALIIWRAWKADRRASSSAAGAAG